MTRELIWLTYDCFVLISKITWLITQPTSNPNSVGRSTVTQSYHKSNRPVGYRISDVTCIIDNMTRLCNGMFNVAKVNAREFCGVPNSCIKRPVDNGSDTNYGSALRHGPSLTLAAYYSPEANRGSLVLTKFSRSPHRIWGIREQRWWRQGFRQRLEIIATCSVANRKEDIRS